MHTFTDKREAVWDIELNIGIIEETKATLDIDLLDPVGNDSQLLVDLSPIEPANIKRFCHLLAFLCEEQYDEKGISAAKEFTRLLDSATIKRAYDAFFEEWADFFLSLDRRDIAEAIKKIREVLKEGVTRVTVEINKLKYPTDNSSTNLPESLE